MSAKIYKLKTIEDIYSEIPSVKIDEFMSELAELIKQCQTIRDGIALLGGDSEFPEFIEWIDDSKGSVSIDAIINDQRAFIVEKVIK